MLSRPLVEFFVFNSVIYYNNRPNVTTGSPLRSTGSIDAYKGLLNVAPGSLSLYEYNVDRPKKAATSTVPQKPHTDAYGKLAPAGPHIPDTGRIYAWITKDSARAEFKTMGAVTYNTDFKYGDTITFDYPLSASITREFMSDGGWPDKNKAMDSSNKYHSSYMSLRNRLDFYGTKNENYKVSNGVFNKDSQVMNMIQIPSIFYGSQIQPGTVSLKWYFTGDLIAELKDTRQNGELIQLSANKAGPDANQYSGSVAGVVLYNEGIILLTGSWALGNDQIRLQGPLAADVYPQWIHFAAGANDTTGSTSPGWGDVSFSSASFGISFRGTTETQVSTLFAHAKRGEVNYSNNPTYLKYGQTKTLYTSSHVYEEKSDVEIANTVSSSYTDFTASFKRQVYVSRIGVYDKSRNLISLATLANPVLKEEDQEYTFKLKMDI